MQPKKLSVVVPIFNEEGNIRALDFEIRQAVSACAETAEIIYVNDGSTDNSMSYLNSLKGVTIINLNRNYGQAVALDAGFKHALGDVIVSIDGDGQSDPSDIPLLLEKMEEGNYDVVAGWRKKKMEATDTNILKKFGRILRRAMVSEIVHDPSCTLRAYKKEAVKRLDIGGEMHRYIIALLKWKGFTIGEAIVSDRPRIHGHSKYSLIKATRGLIDLIYIWFINKYSGGPLHAFGFCALLCFAAGIFSFIVTLEQKMYEGIGFSDNGWFLFAIFLTLLSIMLFSFGIMIDLLISIKLTSSPFERRYHIREVIEKLEGKE